MYASHNPCTLPGALVACAAVCLLSAPFARAQFVDHFDEAATAGWDYNTGDGQVRMDFSASGDGQAVIRVDATQDRYNIWWALVRREVSEALDLDLLEEPDHELRIEARIRLSHAPRRVNLHLNTQRTTDFHTHLMEFDIPDTTGWHTISMTTHDFDAGPGDVVNAQLALIDWGLERYRLDVDYFRVDVVDTTRTGPDRGEQVPYDPPVPPLESFSKRLEVAEAGMIDLDHPDVNLSGWRIDGSDVPVLTVDGTRLAVLRWNLDGYEDASGSAVLALTTYSLQRGDYALDEFGQIRLVEIRGGDPAWTGETLTHDRFTNGQALADVVSPQMIVDVAPDPEKGATTLITIPRPVIRRMIDGQTRGIMLRPLGPVSASFFGSTASDEGEGPILYFQAADRD